MGVGPITPDSSGGELMGTQLAAHLADTSDAHDASAISVLDTAGNYAAADVESAFTELPSTFIKLDPSTQDLTNLETALSTQPWRWIALDGSGDYVSTPSIAGHANIRTVQALVAPTDWTPSSRQTIVGKWDAGGTRAFLFQITSTTIEYLITTDGNDTGKITAGSAPTPVGFTDGTAKWIQATRNPTTGVTTISWAAGNEAVPTSWTALATTSGASGTMYNGSASLRVGSLWTVTEQFNGKVYRVRCLDSGGSAIADFFANDHTTGSTWTSSATGETWTMSGNAAKTGYSLSTRKRLRSDTGIINALDYVDPAASATSQTSGFQTWATALGVAATTRDSGVVGVVPPASYSLNGAVVFPDTAEGRPVIIWTPGAKFTLASGVTNTVMFGTEIPTSSTIAAATARLHWRWMGGIFIGNTSSGNTALGLNCTRRMRVDSSYFTGWTTDIRVRSSEHVHLHGTWHKSTSVTTNNVRVETTTGDWTGATVANTASHGFLMDGNCRLYGYTGQGAQVKVVDSEFTLRECTFEGGNPTINVDFASTNTSTLEGLVENIHVENKATTARLRVSTVHNFEADFQYVVHEDGDAPLIKVLAANSITVRRTGYPYLASTFAGTTPPFDTAAATTAKWIFRGSGRNTIAPSTSALWVGGTLPTGGIYADEVAVDGTRIYLVADDEGTTHELTVNSAGKLLIDGTVVGTQS